jgi:hypothetical protein
MLKDYIEINQFKKKLKNKSQPILSFEIGDTCHNPIKDKP